MLSKCTEVVSTFYPVLQQETAGLPIIGWCFKVWKIQHFSVTQILREINFGECESLKSVKFAI